MIGVDTNVLVRYLVQDDPDQSRRATAFFEREQDESFFLSSVVLCETVWVLSFAYRYRRGRIAAVLRQILRTSQFEVEEPESARRALDLYEQGQGDFADFVILERCHTAGCDTVATFDRKLQRSAGFSSP